MNRNIIILLIFITSLPAAKGLPGYDLWLNYRASENTRYLDQQRAAIQQFAVFENSPTGDIIQKELTMALSTILDRDIPMANKEEADLLVIRSDKLQSGLFSEAELQQIGNEGYMIKSINAQTVITAKTGTGLLYGSFHFIRLLQTQQDITNLHIIENPRVDIRILNHWDNLDRTSERGYAGFSLWDWHRLPDYIDPRYEDYARANASISINGAVLTNVNSNAWVLTESYIDKVKALADVFRPYGIKVYLTARFSAPVEIGALETADPLDANVIAWWDNKVSEIYEKIPDFGGFLVKANSEGQPGPQDYDRSHAEGANMIARALKPHGGVVMWRAFV